MLKIIKNYAAALSLLGCAIFFVFPGNVWADSGDFVISVPTIKPPDTILAGREAVGEYTFINKNTVRFELVDRSQLPGNSVLLSGGGYCGSDIIINQTNQPGSSCIAGFILPAQQNPTRMNGQVIKHFAGTDQNVLADPFTTQVVATPQPNMPHLNIDDNKIYLQPGVTEYINITNTSPNIVANNVKFDLLPQHAAKIATTSGCYAIAPQATCQMAVTMKSNAPFDPRPMPIYIQGANTFPLSAQGILTKDLVAESVTFVKPGAEVLHLVNPTAQAIKITSVDFVSSAKRSSGTGAINSVAIGDFNHCNNIKANMGSCDVPLTAATNAYGSANIKVGYNAVGQSDTKYVTANVAVNPTNLKLFDEHSNPINDSEITAAYQALPQVFKLQNTGNFAWMNANLNLNLTGVAILGDTCSGNVINPGDACVFELKIDKDNAKYGDSALLSFTGDNLAEVNNNVIIAGDLAIVPEVDFSKEHLSYRAIKIKNPTAWDANIINVAVSKNLKDGRIKLCAKGDADCSYQTEASCDMNGGALPSGQSCLLWFKALPNDQIGSDETSGSIGVTVYMEWKNNGSAYTDLPPPADGLVGVQLVKKKTLAVVYDQDLYASGAFTNPGNFLAKWDGNSWTKISNSMNEVIYALTNLNGDLYVGGLFEKPFSYIARWNGATWTALGNGVSGPVYALDWVNNNLYAGGNFSQAGSIDAANIARWDGNTWAALASGINSIVYTLADANADLFVGGWFANAGKSGANYAARWSNNNWLTLGPSVNDAVETLLFKGGYLYAGGHFTLFDKTPAKYVARWDGSAWSPLGKGMNDSVYALNLMGQDNALYAGGAFTAADDNVVNRVAKWNGQAWQPLGTGMNDSVWSLVSNAGTLYASGPFTNPAQHIAQWSGSQWLPVGAGFDSGATALIFAQSLVISESESTNK